MSEKPEALRLIQHMDDNYADDWDGIAIRAELRRQHAEIERLTADNEALRRDAERLKANRDNLLWIVKELAANKSENEAEIERLRGLVRHILGDRITPEAYLLFGKAWVDEAHAALRREDV